MPRALRYVLLALGAAAALHSGFAVWKLFREQQAIDFYIYYVAAHLDGRTDVDDIYGADVQKRVGEEEYARAQSGTSWLQKQDATYRRTLDNVSSPFLYTCFTWLPRDYDRALGIYRALLVLSFGAGVVLLGIAAGLPWAASFFLSALLLRFFYPFHTDVLVGNVSSFQLLAIGVFAVVCRRFAIAGGVVIGLLLAFKPTLIWMVILLVLARIAAREFPRLAREAAGAIAGGLLAFAAAAINFGSARVWLQWIPVAGGFYGRLPGRESNNVTPALALFERFGSSLSLVLAVFVLAIVAFLLFRRRSTNDVLLAGIGAMVYLLSAPVVWLGYLCLSIPVAIALLRRVGTAIVSLLALFAMSGQWLFLAGQAPRPLDARVLTPALLALFLGSLWMLARGEREEDLRT